MAERSTLPVPTPAVQAFLLWVVFMAVNVVHHGTIQFILGSDMQGWVYSSTHLALSGFLVYGLIFLVAPLIMVKGWQTVRQPAFLIPLAAAVVSASLWSSLRGIGLVIILALVYLHLRFDLSEFGLRSSGWRGDITATIAVCALYLVPRLLKPIGGLDPQAGLAAGAFRMLGNPATSAEYFFYFGFLASRLSASFRSGPTSVAVGLMYMLHEMTNPEYWYEGTEFAMLFVGVSIACAIYLWRRSLLPIWLGDGLARTIGALLA